jgi:hypothetical protein
LTSPGVDDIRQGKKQGFFSRIVLWTGCGLYGRKQKREEVMGEGEHKETLDFARLFQEEFLGRYSSI